MSALRAYLFLSHCAQGSWRGMEKRGAKDANWKLVCHAHTCRCRKAKLYGHIDTCLSYVHTNFYLTAPRGLGVAWKSMAQVTPDGSVGCMPRCAGAGKRNFRSRLRHV